MVHLTLHSKYDKIQYSHLEIVFKVLFIFSIKTTRYKERDLISRIHKLLCYHEEVSFTHHHMTKITVQCTHREVKYLEKLAPHAVFAK